MPPKVYRVKLQHKQTVAHETVVFKFEKPIGYKHKAGQFIVLRILDLESTDEKETRHFFTLSSAPYEKHLAVTTRIRGTQLKQKLSSYKLGREVEITEAMGSFVLDKLESLVVFLAGGIGITPFRSIALQEAFEKSPRNIILFYSSPSLKEMSYLEELKKVGEINQNFKLIPIITRDENWKGEKDHVSLEMIKKYVPNPSDAIFYSAGPPQMVEILKNMLLRSNIPQEHVKVEEFEGY